MEYVFQTSSDAIQMTEEVIKQYLEYHFDPLPNDDFKMELN